MEAKDTVMNSSILNNVAHSETILDGVGLWERRFRAIAEAQAEISFPLGEKQGIKKVVEWVKDNELYWRSVSTTNHDYYIPLSLADVWQAKLKEWRIDGD